MPELGEERLNVAWVLKLLIENVGRMALLQILLAKKVATSGRQLLGEDHFLDGDVGLHPLLDLEVRLLASFGDALRSEACFLILHAHGCVWLLPAELGLRIRLRVCLEESRLMRVDCDGHATPGRRIVVHRRLGIPIGYQLAVTVRMRRLQSLQRPIQGYVSICMQYFIHYLALKLQRLDMQLGFVQQEIGLAL